MKLTIITVSYNTKELLDKCIKSVFSADIKTDFNMVVVDNVSSDGSVEMVKKKYPKIKLIENSDNLGFSKANNQALKKYDSDYYLLLNSDTEVMEGSIDKMIEFIKENNYGIGSCKLKYPNGSFQPNVGDLPYIFALFNWLSGIDDIFAKLGIITPSFHINSPKYYQSEREVGWVAGGVFLITKATIEKIGYLDDAIFMYGEDTEYCLRAKQNNIKVGFTPNATIMHVSGGSFKTPKFNQWIGEFRGLLYIYKKHFGLFYTYLLRFLFYFFIELRSVVFLILGKKQISQTYAKILFSI